MAFTISGTNGLTFPDATTQATSGGLTSAASVAAASQTNIDFTSIPSTVKAILIGFGGLTSTAGAIRVQIGTGGTPQTSGYVGTHTAISTTSVASTTNTSGFDSYSTESAGMIMLTRQDSSANTWCAFGSIPVVGYAYNNLTAGYVTLSGALNIVRITQTSGTFSSGKVNIQYWT